MIPTSEGRNKTAKPPSLPLLPSALVNACDVQELRAVLQDYPKLAEVFKSPDDLIHALKVIASIRPHEKFSTSSGIFIHTEVQTPPTWHHWIKHYLQPLWLVRLTQGEDRLSNLRAIKSIFVGALGVVDESLQERELLGAAKKDSNVKRSELVRKMKNEQLITRLSDAMEKASNSLSNLKQTYEGDAHVCARIDMLCEMIRDRLALVKTSLELLKI